MSNERRLEPGYYNFSDAFIQNYDKSKRLDISQMIHMLSFTESMSSGHMRGSAVIVDTLNMLERFPLLGEEWFTLKYTDALEERDSQSFFIYSVTDVEPNKVGNGVSYKIHFTTIEKANSEKSIINKSYRGIISDIAQSVFSEYFDVDNKKFTVEKSDGENVFVIPRYTPERVMHFLAQRAYSNKSKSNSFRFFESRRGFYLVSDQWVIDNAEPVSLYYDCFPDFDGEGLLKQMSSVIKLRNPVRADSLGTVMSGGFKRRALEIDVLEKSTYENETTYDDLKDDFPKHDGKQRDRNTSLFVEDYTKDRVEGPTVYRDYFSDSSNGFGAKPYTGYPEILNNKRMYFGHTMDSRLELKINGRNDIYAGAMINLYQPQYRVTDDKKSDKPTSGKYIVESVSTNFIEEHMTQDIVVTKLDWNGSD